jgi:hypothetical protein
MDDYGSFATLGKLNLDGVKVGKDAGDHHIDNINSFLTASVL